VANTCRPPAKILAIKSWLAWYLTQSSSLSLVLKKFHRFLWVSFLSHILWILFEAKFSPNVCWFTTCSKCWDGAQAYGVGALSGLNRPNLLRFPYRPFDAPHVTLRFFSGQFLFRWKTLPQLKHDFLFCISPIASIISCFSSCLGKSSICSDVTIMFIIGALIQSLKIWDSKNFAVLTASVKLETSLNFRTFFIPGWSPLIKIGRIILSLEVLFKSGYASKSNFLNSSWNSRTV